MNIKILHKNINFFKSLPSPTIAPVDLTCGMVSCPSTSPASHNMERLLNADNALAQQTGRSIRRFSFDTSRRSKVKSRQNSG
jgi:hypothetical protein